MSLFCPIQDFDPTTTLTYCFFQNYTSQQTPLMKYSTSKKLRLEKTRRVRYNYESFCKDDIVRLQLQNWTFSVKLETQIWSGNCAIKSDAKKVLFAPRLLHNLQLSVPYHSHPIKLGPKEQAEKQTVDEFFLWFHLVMFKVYSLHNN